MKLINLTRNFILNLWAERPFWQFMSIIIIVTLLLVTVFAFSYYSIGPLTHLSLNNLPGISSKPFLPCFERSFLTLVTLSNEAGECQGSVIWIDKLFTNVELFFGIFFFASIVAFFTSVVLRPKKIFTFKSSLNMSRQNNRLKIVCSVYNASPVPATNLHVRIIARARVNENTLRNIVLLDGPPAHALAEPYIPLRINAELTDHDIFVSKIDDRNKVINLSHQRQTDNKPLSIEELYVDISGVLVGIEQSVHAHKRYIIKQGDLFFGKHNSVDANYTFARNKGLFKRLVPPEGFMQNLESNGEPLTITKKQQYVFGYGSLVNPGSFSKSIGRNEWLAEDFPLVTLQGYKRVWNIAMDNDVSIPNYKRYKTGPDGDYPSCLVTFLNIKPSETNDIIGTMVCVNDDELDALKKRERNYSLVDVTESIAHCSIDSKIYAFVGTPEAEGRFNSRTVKKPAVISEQYFKLVDYAYRSRGKAAYENYLNTTEKDDSLKLLYLEKVNI